MKPLGKIRVRIGNKEATFALRKELLVGRDEAMLQVRKMRLAWIASLQGDSSATSGEPLRVANVTAEDGLLTSTLPPIFDEPAFQAAEDQPDFDEWMESMDQ
jgi:hypothetical protein